MSSFTLKQHGITVDEIHRNLPASALYEHAILHEKDAHIAENGALVAYSGAKTGRSPKDKRVVKQGASSCDSGGERRVFEEPARGALIITPIAHLSVTAEFRRAEVSISSFIVCVWGTYLGVLATLRPVFL
jgi:hypothetical protein